MRPDRWIALLVFVCLLAAAQTTWQEEAETVVRNTRLDAARADDPLASGGAAIRLPTQAGMSGWSIVFSGPRQECAGPVWFTFWLRSENLLPIANSLTVTLVAHDKTTGLWAFHNPYPVYGVQLRNDAYTPVRLRLDLPLATETYGMEIIMTWNLETPDHLPVIYFDKVSMDAPPATAPAITRVITDKVWYPPRAHVQVRTTIENPLSTPLTAELIGTERRGIAEQRTVFSRRLTLAPGENQVDQTYRLGRDEYGREITVELRAGDRTVSTARHVFTVSANPIYLSSGNGYDQDGKRARFHGVMYVAPASDLQSLGAVEEARSHYGTYSEFFSWAPGDIADLAPRDTIFPGGEGRLTYKSRHEVRTQVRLLREAGMWPVSYVNGTCWAEAGYDLYLRHPEWFMYDANGELAKYLMDLHQRYLARGQADFDPNSYPTIFFQGVLNHSLPDVQEYIADQFIACGREMGFQGIRMDVRYLEVHPGEYDFAGNQIAPTDEQADRISAAAVQRIKHLVHRKLPDFTFGYNFCAPEEVKSMMATFRERCEGGAWMLDELPCTYQDASSPYHRWDAYLPRMTGWSDQVRQLGGTYNPFDFRRNGAKYRVDRIYSNIIRLMAGGRFSCLRHSRLPYGDLGRLATRHSELLFGSRLRLVDAPASRVRVDAPALVWWGHAVLTNRTTDGDDQLIVHLLNPPLHDNVEGDPLSQLRPPVDGITVTALPVHGKPPKRAWLVAAEPDRLAELQDEPRCEPLSLTAAPDGAIRVSVPPVLFWKMVVFEW